MLLKMIQTVTTPTESKSILNCTSFDAPMICNSRQEGIISRIIDTKYGFVESEGEVLFFHISEVHSVEEIACIEVGSRVTFERKSKDGWATGHNKDKCVDVRLVPYSKNAYRDWKGVVQNDMHGNYTFIETDNNGPTVLLHSDEIVDNATICSGQTVRFDVSWNHKHTPPKPYATRVRVESHSPTSKTTPTKNEWKRNQSVTGETHDTTTSRICKFGVKCGRDYCHYRHPDGKRISNGVWKRGETQTDDMKGFTNFNCKYGERCTRSDCWYSHPWEKPRASSTKKSTRRMKPLMTNDTLVAMNNEE